MKAIFFLTFFCAAFIFVGCQKDDSTNSTKTKTELLTSSAWKYDKAQIDINNDGTGDQALPSGFVEACQTDNAITFAASGTGTINEGPTKCDATDPQTIPFTWSFTSNETMINFSSPLFAGLGGDFKVVSLTETQLVISQSVTIPPSPIALSIIATFKH